MIKHSITLYSFGKKFADGDYSVEDCVKRAMELGAEGIELVPSQMTPGYPWPTKAWIEDFREVCHKHGAKPVCYSAYIDMGTRSDRDLNEAEIMESTINDLSIASQLGFQIVRSQHAMSPRILEKLIPYAQTYNLHLAIEMHHPHEPSTPVWREYMNVFRRNDSSFIGVVPDFSSFQEHAPETYRIQAKTVLGIRDDIVDYVMDSQRNWESQESVQAGVVRLGGGEKEADFVREVYFLFPHPADLEGFKELLPYSKYIHGKFYYINDEGMDDCIPYDKIMPIIRESGFDGYLCTEFEGNRFSEALDGEQQIARHIKMIDRYLK